LREDKKRGGGGRRMTNTSFSPIGMGCIPVLVELKGLIDI
jgi:hypothetical protein